MTSLSHSITALITHYHLDFWGNVPSEILNYNKITGISLDSRNLAPQQIFAALPGRTHHGAQFAVEAIQYGASAILTDVQGLGIIQATSEQDNIPVLISNNLQEQLGSIAADIYGHPTQNLDLIGITGTSGKTTTSYLSRAALGDIAHTGLLGTIEIRLGKERLPSSLTTPQAPQLQSVLSFMLEKSARTVIMEVSSHALSQFRVAGCQFTIAAFTNLSHDHLDYHTTMEEYFLAKTQLFIDPRYGHPIPVINLDDVWGQRLAQELSGDERMITVSTHPAHKAMWMAGRSYVVRGGQRFSFTDPHGAKHEAYLKLPGRYNVANAISAIAIGVAHGIELDDIVHAIAQVSVPGRLEVVDMGQSFIAVVDYAHKPAALTAVLKTMREVTHNTGGRLGIVFGAGGDRDKKKRAIMGQIAAHMADLVIVTDDNPRSEDPAAIRQEILRGANSTVSRAKICEISSREEAIHYACQWAKSGDVIIIAGKGHEQGQEIRGVKIPFDDRQQLARAIEAKTQVINS